MTLSETDITLDLHNFIDPIDLQTSFGQAAPVQVEVGTGKGTFLLNQARLRPDVNFIGIEWANKYYRHCLDRFRRWQIPNVRMLHADARAFIGHVLPDQSIDVFHVYFPDPWPKRRHNKRRFFAPENSLQLARCLVPNGHLKVVTDHKEYFQTIQDVLLQHPVVKTLFDPVDFFPAETTDSGEWVGTNFERKYIIQGRQFYPLALKRNDTPAPVGRLGGHEQSTRQL